MKSIIYCFSFKKLKQLEKLNKYIVIIIPTTITNSSHFLVKQTSIYFSSSHITLHTLRTTIKLEKKIMDNNKNKIIMYYI